VDGSTHWDEPAQAKDMKRDHWLAGQGVMVLRIPASSIYQDAGAVADAVIRAADERIAAERQRMELAPSTPRSSAGLRPASAGGPPPAASRGR